MKDQLIGSGVAAIVSLGLHGAAAVVVLSLPSGWLAARDRVEPVTIEIEMEPPAEAEAELVEPSPELPMEPAEPEVAEPAERELVEPELAPAAAIVPPSAESTVTPEAGGSGVPSSIQAPDVSTSNAPPQRSEQAMQVLLAPSNVARGAYTATGPGPSRPSGPAGLDVGRRGPTEQELEAMHSGHLRTTAMSRPHITRERIVPRRQADGSYLWQGHMFTARIERSGEVRFSAADDVGYDLATGSGSFGLEEAIMRAQGQNPAAAEQARFMRETEELRDRLEDEHRATERRRAAVAVRGRIRRTWGTTSRSPESRRRRIFQLWDEIAEDGSMDEARAAVLEWVRETLPEGSEDAYTEAELTRLNASRSSTERFAPY